MSGYEYGSLAGFIFMCNSSTKPQCYQYRVFGLPFERLETARQVNCGTKLFLYDFELKLLYGIYEATSSGHLNIQPNAFGGRFPSQVSFRIYKDCLPLPETVFRHAICENYNGSKFRQELGNEQVKALMELFRPIYSVAPYSRELHQQSTSYPRLPPLPRGCYWTPQYNGTQVAGPHSETQNVNVDPPHFPVNDPYRRDVAAAAAAATAQAPQGYAYPPMLHQSSPSYYSAAHPHPQYLGHHVVANYQPYNDNSHYMYKQQQQQQQQQQPPSHDYQQHHGSAAAVGGQLPVYEQPPSHDYQQHHGSAAAVGGQLPVYEYANNAPPQNYTQGEPNGPSQNRG